MSSLLHFAHTKHIPSFTQEYLATTSPFEQNTPARNYNNWDWHAFFEKGFDAQKDDVNTLYRAAALAANWVTCAVGNQCSVIPRDEDALRAPKDPELYKLGTEFFRCVDCCAYIVSRIVEHGKEADITVLHSESSTEHELTYAAAKKQFYYAMGLLHAIEVRSAYLLKKILPFQNGWTRVDAATAVREGDTYAEEQPAGTLFLKCNNTGWFIHRLPNGKYYTYALRDEWLGTFAECVQLLTNNFPNIG